MTKPIDNLDELLARVADGRLDDLTPEQVAALEAHLDATPPAADRLAGVTPTPDPQLTAAPPTPSETEWNGIWQRIDSAIPMRGPTPTVIARVIRLWRPLAAAAACLLLLLVLWRLAPSTPSWEIHLSNDVVVHELEVFGNSSAFVAYSDDDDGSAMIWVFEEDEDSQGA